ncbi:hypothetical protein [Leuconostoc pseudomesenteroides]|uniref:hypothetical protein n=1 Tax=Leuconostoc pseudomesenteroides TaxID=33968 RepID=UPI002899CBAF|nr:hypothetical protein [Leuconostoc pseudomesenteroides]
MIIFITVTAILVTYFSRFLMIKQHVNLLLKKTESKVVLDNKESIKILFLLTKADFQLGWSYVKTKQFKSFKKLIVTEIFYFDRQVAIFSRILYNTVLAFEENGYVLVMENPAAYRANKEPKPMLNQESGLPWEWVKGGLQMMFDSSYKFSIQNQ